MGKYLVVVSNSIKKSLAYRASSFFLIFSAFFTFLVLFYFWTSIYKQGNQIGNYSLQQMISYYIFVAIFELIFSSNTAWGVGHEIKEGLIVNNILKPMGYLEYKVAQSIGSFFYRLLFFAPVIFLVLFFSKNILTQPKDEYGYLIFISLSILSYFVNFFIYYIAGLTSFWIDDYYGFLYALMVIISFVQGQLLPLDLMPDWFNNISNYLPFKYLYFVPIQIAAGRINFSFSMLLVPLIWCTIFYFIAQFLFRKGIKKYEGYGI